jgi:hypothetical protein
MGKARRLRTDILVPRRIDGKYPKPSDDNVAQKFWLALLRLEFFTDAPEICDEHAAEICKKSRAGRSSGLMALDLIFHSVLDGARELFDLIRLLDDVE